MEKDQAIAQWLFNNKGATDAQIRAAMDQYGVTINDMARVTGGDFGDIASRYVQAGVANAQPQAPQTQQAPQQAAQAPQSKDQAIAEWLYKNNGASDQQIRSAMDQYGVSVQDMARVTGADQSEVAARYAKAGAPQPQQTPPGMGSQSQSTPTNLGIGGYQQNPYLGQMAQSITGQVNQNLLRNILPGIRSGAIAAGGYGGSRQGVVEANALNDANQGLSNSLTSMYYGDFNNAQNRNLQQQSLDNSYNLGLGNLGLNAQNAQNSFYTAQRGQDLQQYGLGASLVNQANQGYLNQGSGIYDAGSIYQQSPWGTIGNFNSATTPYTGFGAASTQSQSANPWAQALGGAVLGGQIGRLF